MEMCEVLPDAYDEGYINSNLNSLTNFTSDRVTEFKDILPGNLSQMITKTAPISLRIVIICHETGHHILNLMKSQWKLRQQHDQNFPMVGKPW